MNTRSERAAHGEGPEHRDAVGALALHGVEVGAPV
eukprot:COSAG01_NODE_49660_length_370_cov_0.848708_1_plen_34_part_01